MDDINSLVKLSPRQKYVWRFSISAVLYIFFQSLVSVGLIVNMDEIDYMYLILTIASFIAYFNVSFSNPGYIKI